MSIKKDCRHKRLHWSDLWQHPKTLEPYAPCNGSWLCRIQLGPHYRIMEDGKGRVLHLSLCGDPDGVVYVIDEGLVAKQRALALDKKGMV